MYSLFVDDGFTLIELGFKLSLLYYGLYLPIVKKCCELLWFLICSKSYFIFF